MSDRDNKKPEKPSKRDRLQALLFGGAVLGTTIVMLGGPKLPPLKGD